MADDIGNWAALAQWVLSNPEKCALFLVLIAGAWRWIREPKSEAKVDDSKESFMDLLIRENKEKTLENKELRSELRRSRRKNAGEDENSERPP